MATLLGAVALFPAGCAQEDDAHHLRSPDVAGPSAEEADVALADSTLLTLDDLPDSWSTLAGSRAQAGSDAGGQFHADMARCLGRDDGALNGDYAHATTPYFVSPAGDTVRLTVSLLPDDDGSRLLIEILGSEEATVCWDETYLAANAAGPESEPNEPELADASTVLAPYADFGNTTVAWRTTTRWFDGPDQLNVYVDFVAVRVGRALITANFQSQGRPYDRDQSEGVMVVVVDRVTEAIAEES